MKKLMYLAAALLVLVGCNNNEEVTTPQTTKGTSFQQGDKVILTTGCTQAPARKVNGGITSNGVEFTWEDGDSLTITVGEATAQFYLTKGAGTQNGVFEGTMPAAGETFTAEYIGEEIDMLGYSDQAYVENGIDMRFVHAKADNCVVTEEGWSEISLTVDNAAVLIFNLQCDKKLAGIAIRFPENYAPARTDRKAHGGPLITMYSEEGVQLSATTPTRVAVLASEDFLNTPLEAEVSFLEGYDEYEWPIYDENREMPDFQINASIGQTVNYPVKKWVNLSLPNDLLQTPSKLFCAQGEKMELNFYGDKSELETNRIDFKIGDHLIFSQTLLDYIPVTADNEQKYTYYDASDNNQPYDVCVKYVALENILEFTVTSKVSAYALNNAFTAELVSVPL